MNPITDSALQQLRDIHLPEPVGWWPLAYGWWLLLGVFLIGLLALWLRHRRRYRERAALKGLKAVAKALADGRAPGWCIQQISMIMRRFAMSAAGARPVAGLTGEQWLRFLDSRWERDEFSEGIGRVLIYGPYAPAERVGADDVGALNELCIDWIRAQRPITEA